jgi:hypothetical protein
VANKVLTLNEKKRRLEWKEEQKKKINRATNNKPPAVRQPEKYRYRKEKKCPSRMEKCSPY